RGKVPMLLIESRTITVSPAAGPLTLTLEPDNAPTTIPPTIPAISPDMGGAPLAIAIPKQRGRATKNTTKLDFKSYFKFFPKRLFIGFIASYMIRLVGCIQNIK